ncbi:MAG: DUF389 domain-containing protein [Pseudomonadota bacterium]|nr:DUF389 domain-containing protein [Pseudomonadota bacterium]
MEFSISITDQRKQKVYEELRQGSDPRRAFFLLVAVSTLIAAFGLAMNNTAVVIGAMLVAPLMTPILGLALGLLRGIPSLIGLAARSEALGVLVSIGMGFILGITLPSYFDITPEMLSRTEPGVADLLVAVLAGIAGAYALIDEKLSPALPGVAISTAIVPPLANCGMCLALGAYGGAAGSFLLFFTNFLSILLVSGLVFHVAGMSQAFRLKEGRKIVRRFGVALLGFVIVTSLLSFELVKLYTDRQLQKQVAIMLQKEFSSLRITNLEKLVIENKDGGILVRADVNAPDVVAPRTISAIEKRLAEITGQPTRLFIRTTVTHDVSASGSINQFVEQTLDGISTTETGDLRLATLQSAEQIMREYLGERRGIRLESLNLIPSGPLMILIAQISGVRQLAIEEIKELEILIQNQVAEGKKTRLLVQQEISELSDSLGSLRTEFTMPQSGDLPVEVTDKMKSIAVFARTWLESRDYWLHGWSITILDDDYHLLLEVRGTELFDSEQRQAIKQELANEFEVSVEVYVRSQLDTVVGPGGHIAFPDLLDDFRRRNRAAYGDEIKRSIIEAR